MADAENGVGARIYYGAIDGGTPSTEFLEIKSVSEMPGVSRETYDTTRLGQRTGDEIDQDKHFAVSQRRDPGQLKFLVGRTDEVIAQLDELDDGVKRKFRIALASGGTIDFTGAQTMYVEGPPVDDEMTFEVTLKADSKRVFTPGA